MRNHATYAKFQFFLEMDEEEGQFVPEYLEEEVESASTSRRFRSRIPVYVGKKEPSYDGREPSHDGTDKEPSYDGRRQRGRKRKVEEAQLVRKARKSECHQCGIPTAHLKQHVFKCHICPQFWELLPLFICWVCSSFEYSSHIKEHGGTFRTETHWRWFEEGVQRFLEHVMSFLRLGNIEELYYVVQMKFSCIASVFTAEEIIILDEFDRRAGLRRLRSRNAAVPDRVSTLLHWKTIHNLLLLCARRQVRNFRVEVQAPEPIEPKRPLVVTVGKSNSQRTVTFHEEKPSSSHKEKPSSSSASSHKEKPSSSSASSHKEKPSSSSTSSHRPSPKLVMLPGEDSVDLHYIDGHCHLDRLFQAQKHKGTLMEYLQRAQRFVCPYFLKCVTVFCDLQRLHQHPYLVKILDEAGIYGCIGCHPKKAREWNSRIAAMMRRYLKQHPKMVAVGEMGLDYSRNPSERERRLQETVLREQLDIAVQFPAKPVVIHARDAMIPCLRIVRKVLASDHKIYLHANHGGWSDTVAWIRKFPDTFIGAAGSCTYPENEEANEMIRCAPLSRLILETDAPHLKPREAPRGTTTDPIMALQVARRIAEVKGISVQEVLKQCFQNTNRLYHLE